MDKGYLKSVDSLSHSQPSGGRTALVLAAALAACFGVRVWLVGHAETITKDGVGYVAMARRWSVDPADAVRIGGLQPGYSAAISFMRAVVVRCGGPTDITGWDLAGQVTSLVAAVAAMAAVWLFASSLMDRRIALVAVLLFGFARKWSVAGADVIAESLAVCLQMWAMVAALWVLRLLRSGRAAALLAAAATGALCAGAYYVRTEAAHVAVVIAVCWLVCGLRGRKLSRALGATVVLLAAAGACVAPYMLYVGAPTNDEVFAQFSAQPAVAEAPGDVAAPPDGEAPDRAAGEPSAGQAEDEPAPEAPPPLGRLYAGLDRFVGQLFEAMHPVLGFAMCTWLVTWLGAKVMRSRLLSAIAGKPHLPAGLLLIGSLAIMGSVTTWHFLRSGYLSHRYLLINAAMLSPLAAAGVMVVVHWICVLGRKLRLPVFPRAAMCVVVGIVAAALLLHTLQPVHEGKAYIKQAGLDVAQHAREGDFLITDRALILHYAQIDGEHLRPPVGISDVRTWADLPDAPATIVAASDGKSPDEEMVLSDYLSRQEGAALLGRHRRADRPDGDTIVIFRLNASP